MKFYLSAVLLVFFVCACNTDSEEDIFDANILDIENYLSENNLDAIVTDSGLHYIILDEGSVNHPNSQNEIRIDVRGYLLDGTTFDTQEDVTYDLPVKIIGWQEGIPLIGKGGKIMLLVPSRLAYGDMVPDGLGIPADVPLLYDITLKDFN